MPGTTDTPHAKHTGRTVRIGCGSGFWGDSPEGPRQLVMDGSIDYLVLDYLAEITMSILARAKARKPELGYATDFVTQVIAPLADPDSAMTRRLASLAAAAGSA